MTFSNKLKNLDDTDIMFVYAFSKQFNFRPFGIYLAIHTLDNAKISKDGLDSWKSAENLGKLVGETARLLCRFKKNA